MVGRQPDGVIGVGTRATAGHKNRGGRGERKEAHCGWLDLA